MLPSYHGLSRVNILIKENMQLKAFTFSETLDLVCCFSHLKKQLLWLNCTEIALLGKLIPVLNCKSKNAFRDIQCSSGRNPPTPPPPLFLAILFCRKITGWGFFLSFFYWVSNQQQWIISLTPFFWKN